MRPNHAEANAIIPRFGPDGCQFLTLDVNQTNGELPDYAWIDIAHESLIRQWKMLSNWLEKEGSASHEWQRLKDDAGRNAYLSGRRLKDAIEMRDEVKPTPAWAERYGGDFDKVTRLIKVSERRKWGRWIGYAAVIAGILVSVYLVYQKNEEKNQQALIAARNLEEKKQQAVFATRNFEVAVNSAQSLLNQLSTSVARGDITMKGATDMLQLANGIVEQVQSVENTTKTIFLLIDLAHTASDIQAELGKYNEAYDTAKMARDLAEPLQAAEPDNPEVLRRVYASVWRMGDAISYRGTNRPNQEKALAEYQKAEKLARRLLDMSPGDGARGRELMFIHQKIGDVHQALREYDAATVEYRMALTFIQNVLDKAPKNRGWRRDVANTLRRVGEALAVNKDTDGALEQLRNALNILNELVQEDSNDNGVQSNLASIYREIADVHLLRRELDAALAEYDLAIKIQEGLIERDRDNATWHFSLASFYNLAGATLRGQKNLSGALERYREAYSHRQWLARKDPTNSGAQNRFAVAAIPVADLLLAQKQNLNEAVKLCRSAIEILDEARPYYDGDVFNCYIKIGDVLKLQDDGGGALKEYNIASGIAAANATSNPGNAVWQGNLEQSYVKIADFLAAQGRTRDAHEHYQSAIKFVENLVAQNPQIAALSALAERLKEKIGSPVR